MPRLRLGQNSVLIACTTVLVCAACSKPPATPEDEVRQVVTDMEGAVRAKDIALLTDHISARYRDEEERDKQAIKGILVYYFRQNRSIHLLTRVESVELRGEGSAQTTIFAAIAGTQIPDASWLPRIRADLYRIDARWQKEGDAVWRLVEATWEPATTEDFG